MVRIGADRGAPGQMVIDSLDPALILAAATLAAAGYRIERERRVSDDADAPHLSQREQQVAELLAEGASNKVIARELGISVHTAKFHVTAVMEKLGARNRSDAVAISLREGLRDALAFGLLRPLEHQQRAGDHRRIDHLAIEAEGAGGLAVGGGDDALGPGDIGGARAEGCR